MPDKLMLMRRAIPGADRATRPIVLAIAGDSAAGKTTLTKGLVRAFGEESVTAICVDDYHRYDRAERKTLPFTPLHPDCNYVDIMEQHLQLLATGQPILKPVYDHKTGTFVRPEYIEPKRFLIIEGLLPLSTKMARACADVTVYLDPPEELRLKWKIQRDCGKRGYTEEQVLAELRRREPEAAAYIRPQRAHADMVVRFAPVESSANGSAASGNGASRNGGAPGGPEVLSASLLLRPTIPHPDLSTVLLDDTREAIHLKLIRDDDGKPVDALHVHGHARREMSASVEEHIWRDLGAEDGMPPDLGVIGDGVRSEPLAITQLVLVYHLLQLAKEGR